MLCNALNIWHRSRCGFGRGERFRERDKHLDRMQAQLDTTTPLRFKPALKNWRGKARLVSNSRALTMRMWRSMIFCRLDMLAAQQAANQGDNGLLRAYRPRAEAARAIDHQATRLAGAASMCRRGWFATTRFGALKQVSHSILGDAGLGGPN